MPVSIAYIIDTLEADQTGEPNAGIDEAIRQAAGHAPHCLVPLPVGSFPATGGLRITTVEYRAPNYTGSLDAARTLLLPKHSLNIAQLGESDWLVMINLREPAPSHGRRAPCWEGEARTAERALCIAALKARVDR